MDDPPSPLLSGLLAVLVPLPGAAPLPAPPLPPTPRWTVLPGLTRAEMQRLTQQAGSLPLQAFDTCGGTEAGDWPPLYRTR